MQDELVQLGILCFWNTVDIAKCRRYILYLKKIIPKLWIVRMMLLDTKCLLHMYMYIHVAVMLCLLYTYMYVVANTDA